MNTKTEKTKKTGRGEYTLACKKKFQVRYGFSGGKWNFRIGNFTLLTKIPTGKQGADRIAHLLRDSWFRHEQIDGTARNAINKIVNANFKQLKDYRGPWDHNFSWSGKKFVTDTEVQPSAPIVELEQPAELERELAANLAVA